MIGEYRQHGSLYMQGVPPIYNNILITINNLVYKIFKKKGVNEYEEVKIKLFNKYYKNYLPLNKATATTEN